MKTCTHCATAKPPSDFPANRHTRDRLSSWCRACHTQRVREWRAAQRATREAAR